MATIVEPVSPENDVQNVVPPSVETLPEEPVKKSPTAIIMDYLSKKLDKTIYVDIDDKTISILETILNTNPEIFNDMEEPIQKMVADGKINVSDMPSIHILVLKLYTKIKSLKAHKLSSVDAAKAAGIILKTTMHILVEEEVIKVNNKDDVLTVLDYIIDTAVKMLSHMKLNPKNTWIRRIKNFFKIK